MLWRFLGVFLLLFHGFILPVQKRCLTVFIRLANVRKTLDFLRKKWENNKDSENMYGGKS